MAHVEGLSSEEVRQKKVKKIIQVTLLLSAVTAVEFALALLWPDGSDRTLLNVLFLLLTLVKAFFIIAEFMHLKHEVKSLIQSVIIPLVFVIWLVVALMQEGATILNSRNIMKGAEAMMDYIPLFLG